MTASLVVVQGRDAIDDDDWGWDDYSLGQLSIYRKLSKEAIEKARKAHEKMQKKNMAAYPWWKYREFREDSMPREYIFTANVQPAQTCCGFYEIGSFSTQYPSTPEEQAFCGETFSKWLKTQKIPYFYAFTPDKKEWYSVHAALEGAGFIPVVTMPSSHNKRDGTRYNNIKWEWFAPDTKKGK